ncbi:glycosyl hydrolase [bacterium]|nr:MAG: glycosyl hydrolase [bacterium]
MTTRKKLLPAVATFALASCSMAQPYSVLWYNTPAKVGMGEALPIGNGRIGALIYGGETERIVLNDSSLWTGDENTSGDYGTMGSYQMLGELLLQPTTSVPTTTDPIKAPNISSPSGQKPYFANQAVNYANDGNLDTKWCIETGGKPVTWQVEMPVGSDPATWYSFTSAEDVPERDPGTWELAGSMDGQTWASLDKHEGQPPLAKRGDTHRYTFANTTAFRFYRFTFQPKAGVTHFQVAEIALQGVAPVPADGAGSVPIPEGFRRELNLSTATATTEYNRDGVRFRRETFASQPADIIAVRWSANKPGALNGTIELKGAHNETTNAQGTNLSFKGQFKNGLQYTTQSCIIPQGGTTSVVEGKVQLRGCNEALILIGAGTNYVFDYARNYCGPNPEPRVTAQLNSAAKQSFYALKAAHESQFRKVMNRVTLDLGTSSAERASLPTNERLKRQADEGGDPDFQEIQFQYGRYLLISCSRPGGVPANLQGLWNDSNNPPWFSDYHTNINIQMNYWPAEVTNLSEYHTPLFDMIKSQIPAWRKETATSDEWKTPSGEMTTRGFAVRTSHNIHGGMGWRWDKTANAWYCQHLWEHYAFTVDKKYLRETAYPILKETCEFWEDHLKTLPDGRLVVPHGWSPEHGPDEDGVSYNQQIVWDLFNNTVQAAKELDTDADYARKITAMRDKLVGPKIGNWGQLQEWMEDRDDPKDQHRHTSHLFAVFPGKQVSIAKTPQFATAAKVSLDARTNAPGGDVNEWASVWRAATYARLHDGDQAQTLLRRFAGLSAPNMLGNLDGHIVQIDGSFGITAAIAEMLLQSHEDEINLLPALPTAWASGNFAGLRARGGITVDAAWQNGHLTAATLKSDHDTPVKVRNGAKVAILHLKAGKPIRVGASLNAL